MSMFLQGMFIIMTRVLIRAIFSVHAHVYTMGNDVSFGIHYHTSMVRMEFSING